MRKKSIFLMFSLALFLSSCSLYTQTHFRLARNEQYIQGQGYMLSCSQYETKKSPLLVSCFTPGIWGNDFYYSYLGGNTSSKKIKIDSVQIYFPKTAQKLNYQEHKKNDIFVFTNKELSSLLRKNREMELMLFFTDSSSGQTESQNYRLKRKKTLLLNGPHL